MARSMSPTEKVEKRQNIDQQIAEERKILEESFNAVASTPAGQRILQHIARAVGFGKNPTVFKQENGFIMPMEGATLYNGARQSVYTDEIREYLTPNNRMKVEKAL